MLDKKRTCNHCNYDQHYKTCAYKRYCKDSSYLSLSGFCLTDLFKFTIFNGFLKPSKFIKKLFDISRNDPDYNVGYHKTYHMRYDRSSKYYDRRPGKHVHRQTSHRSRISIDRKKILT